MTGTRLVLTTFAAVAVLAASQDLRADRIEQPLPAAISDLQQAQLIEIKNEPGATVMKGTLESKQDKGDKIKKEAKLAGVAGAGKAEVEIKKEKGQVKDQEIELELGRLRYGAPYKIFIDNKEVLAFNADSHGKADLKLSTKITK